MSKRFTQALHQKRNINGKWTHGRCSIISLIRKMQIKDHNKISLHAYRVRAQSISCVWLFCDPVDHSPPSSSIHGIFQARILEWVPISYSRDLPDPGIEPTSPALAGGFFSTEPPGKPHMPTRMVQIKMTDKSKCRHGHGTTETIIHGQWECKISYSFWKTVSRKVKYIISHMTYQLKSKVFT